MGNIRTIHDILTEHPFFNGMKPEYLALIAGCGKIRHFDAGSFLMKEGDAATHFYVIMRGTGAIETYCPQRGALTISRIKEGDVVGFSWLLPPYRVAFDVHAFTGVDAVILDGKCLRDKVEKDHELGYEMMKRFSHLLLNTLHDTQRQLLDVYGVTDVAAGA